jgi:hypothetical protein
MRQLLMDKFARLQTDDVTPSPLKRSRPSSRLETLPPELLRHTTHYVAGDAGLVELHACAPGLRDALAELEVWRDDDRLAAALFWRACAWRMRPRKLFVFLESMLRRNETSALTALVEMGRGRRSLVELHVSSKRWGQSWRDDVTTRRDVFLSFYLNKAAVIEFYDWREHGADYPKNAAERVRPALHCLGMGEHDLLAAVVEVTPYRVKRWISDIKEYEDELRYFKYDPQVHDNDDALDQTDEGWAWIFLPEAVAIMSGVAHLVAWQDPAMGPLTTLIDIPAHKQDKSTEDGLCNDPDMATLELLADLLSLQYYGVLAIEDTGWENPDEEALELMDMRPLADALRYFYRRIGSFYVACVIREIMNVYNEWGPVPRLILLAYMRVKDPHISAAIRGEPFYADRDKWQCGLNSQENFDEYVRTVHREIGLIRPE